MESILTRSVVFWSLAAVLLFWAVGAYNRLMRLRANANTAFAAFDAELGAQVDLIRQHLPQVAAQGVPLERDLSIWASLHAAGSQLAASLAAARHKPLDAERVAALGAAQDALATAWARAQHDDAHDLAGSRLPDTVLLRRDQLMRQAYGAAGQFNQAVARYNEAIAQFPAVLLAWVFGFKPAGALSLANLSAPA
jgi:LemA protein